ncbi:flagellar hook-length control protein FliK [Clostridium sp. MB40-C1]|uniref:flagellar hook-length control protein FliK n=1 Tax=Clostridium sp. MB40-C1 TaxID=3070996 RepID=UPI0027E1CCEC|nr:flagellar hook-length control protein FliK [Clostridium sp. MB40-C1]WMJ81337.1 flagellar hook-length control protein FliK [Clostridium sp. MB40-C1]
MNNGVLNNVQAVKEVTVANKGNTVKGNTKTSTSKEFEKFFKKASIEKRNVVENKNTIQNKSDVENKRVSEESLKEKDVKSTDNASFQKTDDKNLENKNVSEENTIETEIEKLKDSTSKEGYIENLINLLERMLNGEVKVDLDLIQKVVKELNSEIFNQINGSIDSESISKIKNDILQVIKNNFDSQFNFKEINDKSLSEIFDFIAKLPSMNSSENQDFKTEIIKVLKDKLENLNTKEKSLDLSETLSGNAKNKSDLNLNLSKMDNEASAESFEESDSESALLKKLAFSDKDDDKPQFQRVINYMGRINKTQGINPIVEVDSKNLGVVNSKNLVEDLVKDVKFMQLNNLKEMTVKINPKELGQLIIRVTMENGAMKANITAQNKEAYNLLNTNYSELNNKLSDDGIKIQNFTIDIYNGDTTFFSNEKNKHENQQGPSKRSNSNIALNEEDTINVESSNTVDSNSVNAFV